MLQGNTALSEDEIIIPQPVTAQTTSQRAAAPTRLPERHNAAHATTRRGAASRQAFGRG